MRLRYPASILLVCVVAACAPKRVAVVDPSIAARAALAEADELLRAGCFDCLAAALSKYESVRVVAAVASQATLGAVRAAALLAMRERELGTTDSGYLEKARDLASGDAALRDDVAPLLEVIALLPWRAGTGRPDGTDRSVTIYQNRT